jgi:hypothetical protein
MAGPYSQSQKYVPKPCWDNFVRARVTRAVGDGGAADAAVNIATSAGNFMVRDEGSQSCHKVRI